MKSYPYAIAKTGTGWAGGAVQFPSFVTADTRDELIQKISEQLALYLLDAGENGIEVCEPLPVQRLDLRLLEVDRDNHEVVYVEPAAVNPVSLEVERAIRLSGMSKAEVARRMGTLQSVVSNMSNPFYWGHQLAWLSKLAAALNRELEIQLTPAGRKVSYVMRSAV